MPIRISSTYTINSDQQCFIYFALVFYKRHKVQDLSTSDKEVIDEMIDTFYESWMDGAE